MITSSDSLNTVDLGPYYAILPTTADYFAENYAETRGATPVEAGFCYNSGTNPDFMSVEQIREAIRKHVDPTHVA